MEIKGGESLWLWTKFPIIGKELNAIYNILDACKINIFDYNIISICIIRAIKGSMTRANDNWVCFADLIGQRLWCLWAGGKGEGLNAFAIYI